MLRKVNGLKPIADELGVPLSQLAIAWCSANPNVSSVITGATKESQVSFMWVYWFRIYEPFILRSSLIRTCASNPNVSSVEHGWANWESFL